MENSLARVYDVFADQYESNRGIFDMTAVIGDFLPRLGTDRGQLLDLGCGAGEPFPRSFIERGWTVTGVDFSSRMIELAQRYVPQMRTLCADVRDVDFEPGSFDAITMIYSLFHLPAVEQARMFASMYRWLRPGGHALFTYATEAFTGAPEFEGTKEFMGQQLFYAHRRPEQLDAELREQGFDIVAFEMRSIGGEEFLWATVRKPGP